MNAEKYDSPDRLDAILSNQLTQWEAIYGRGEDETTLSSRFLGVIRRASEQAGRGVVVLVDEYDKPLLQAIQNEPLLNSYRSTLKAFYGVLKSADRYLRFAFLTGVTKFSQVSVFSDLNQLNDISLNYDFSTLCGITREELLANFEPEIAALSQANDINTKEVVETMTRQYDGYHFSKICEDIYNPFSLFNAFSQRDYKSFWFSTGTPTFLIEMLQRMDFSLTLLEKMEVKDEDFDKATEVITDPIPVLYQSGYLTIKGYEPLFRTYTLGYPNEEVKIGFIETLIPSYLNQPTRESNFYVVSFVRDLMKGDIEQCLLRTRSFFSSIPYDLENNQEKHYQTIFYLLFRLMGQYVDVEVKNAIGRADVVIKMPDAIYVFEFKVDGTPEEALAQINSKQYAIPYEVEHRKVVKVGVNFDSTTRTLGQWKIEYS